MTTLTLPVESISVRRKGHQPFKSTVLDRLNDAARESVAAAFLRDEIESLRRARKPRNRRR